MKQLSTFKVKTCNKINVIIITSIMLSITQSVFAQTETKSLDVFMSVQYGLSILVPIAAAIILLFLLLIYIFRIIARATFMRWAFSVIIAGAAFYISHILFHLQ
ncbi:conjugal transfer protein [Bartonella krasnovii]|uniref:Conjugal transfer protein n=1 Tax=Bartonella krasnovii TaxID=2267275 RepID=A0ABY3VZJ4_9HYPH|nr:conjugal transfer protein [Bartonella krasnovii]UNF29007.1 conjugal transfer protein [Bartonella krasnovii]UNF35362.1 conjugal transfer protein [Bartonella krasnovii]UNF36991.1 conjugal transfer protein [Bartonella krasnovii]UNF40405.1 conjugal transfer protein [Bartonella krasnovii]UNF48549.1 conjugal transfer protein [Bartonella krasnovii]